MNEPPPLSLYVHFPWCVKKCPYCDFNSHPAKGPLPQEQYISQLLADLDADLPLAGARPLQSIFIGGGTPSLISGDCIAMLLDGVRTRFELSDDVEITLEANPGAIDAQHFTGYRRAGVNRLSIGAQSFDAQQLRVLGRVHAPGDIARAVALANDAGFARLNLDLMYGLPGQTAASAAADLKVAIDLGATHISWYQLTIEARTEFALRPPQLPDEGTLEAIEDSGTTVLADAGFGRYEISAFARPGQASRHNLNYWMFGDYLGIGAGAHGKLSQVAPWRVIRTSKPLAPTRYLGTSPRLLRTEATVRTDALAGEFLLNALRLVDGVDEALLQLRTGNAQTNIEATLARQRARGLMRPDRLALTPLGLRHLDTVVSEFL